MGNIKVLFIPGFGPITAEPTASRTLYNRALSIAFKEENGGYLHTEALQGAKTVALWPLSQAAESCFGKDAWPTEIPAPHAWLEFDVDDVENATRELEAQGHRMLVKNKQEPWGQIVSRFVTAEKRKRTRTRGIGWFVVTSTTVPRISSSSAGPSTANASKAASLTAGLQESP